jgi:hypothetical protein
MPTKLLPPVSVVLNGSPSPPPPPPLAADSGRRELLFHGSRCGAFAVLYGVLRVVLQRVLRSYGPQEFRGATNERQTRTVLFLLSMVNVFVSTLPFLASAKVEWRQRRTLLPDAYASVSMDGSLKHDIVADLSAFPETGEATKAVPSGTATTTKDQQRQARCAQLALHNLLGYFAHDLVTLLLDGGLVKYPVDIVHHVAGLIIGSACLANFRRAYPFVGVFLLGELSTLFLNLMWLMREFPNTTAVFLPHPSIRDTVQNQLVPHCFAASFGLIRVLGFPLMLARMYLSPIRRESSSSGTDTSASSSPLTPAPQANAEPVESNVLTFVVGRTGTSMLGVIQLLQWYWFALIVRKIATRK